MIIEYCYPRPTLCVLHFSFRIIYNLETIIIDTGYCHTLNFNDFILNYKVLFRPKSPYFLKVSTSKLCMHNSKKNTNDLKILSIKHHYLLGTCSKMKSILSFTFHNLSQGINLRNQNLGSIIWWASETCLWSVTLIELACSHLLMTSSIWA